MASLGTTTTVLHGNVGGAPSFGAVVLTTDVSGTLPVGNGGSGAATFTANGVLLGNGVSPFGVTAVGTTGKFLSGNTGSGPTFRSLVSTDLPQVAIRLPVSAATVAILTTDIEVGLDTTSTAVSATLPSAAAWTAANPSGLELVLVDIQGNANIRNITPTLNGADVFSYGGVTPVISANFGSLRLRPTPTGWYVRGIN
jgi:hypothetical protein